MKIKGKYTLTTELIGQGSFSRVFKGIAEDGSPVAVKCINWTYLKQNSEYKKIKDSVRLEIECMKQISCRHIVKFLDVEHIHGWTEDVTYIVMEYCAGGDLSKIIRTKRMTNSTFYEAEVTKILYCIAEGFLVLRKKRLVHRDIKPANLFLTKDSITWSDIKIGDFTFAKKEMDLSSTLCGSPLYMAPEVVLGKKYNEKADLWSIGVILFQMMYGRTPIVADSFADLVVNINNNDIWIAPLNTSDRMYSLPLRSLIKKIIVVDPDKRIGFTEFFESVRSLLVSSAPIPIAAGTRSKSTSLSSYAGSYGAAAEKEVIISPKDAIALGFVHLLPPRIDPFKNMSHSEPKAQKMHVCSVKQLSATTLSSIDECESEYIILPHDIPEMYVKEINVASEMANVLVSDNNLDLALGVYCLILRVVKERIQSETKETSAYNIYVDLYRSVLSQAEIVGRIVREDSIVVLNRRHVDVGNYVFAVCELCIRCANGSGEHGKLPFKCLKNKDLLFAAFSLFNILKMDNTYSPMSDVLFKMESVRKEMNKLSG